MSPVRKERKKLSTSMGSGDRVPSSREFQARYNGPSLEEMTGKQIEFLKSMIMKSRPRTGLNGPFGPWLAMPSIAEPASKLGKACRYDTSLSFRESELVILLVGAKMRSHDTAEFDIHTAEALKAGLTQEIIDSIPRDDDFNVRAVLETVVPQLGSHREKAIAAFTAELLHTSSVSDETYDSALTNLDGKEDSAIVEITSIVGYYTYVCYTLNVFRIPSNCK